MELDWTTFALEIINFLVLVWILSHFLYRPLLDVIARRREQVQQQLDQAGRTRDEAATLKAQYDNRLAGWQREQALARRQLQAQLDAEGGQRREELEQSLQQEREKSRVLMQRELDARLRDNETTALRHGTQFTARLLSRLAGPELERGLARLLLEDLECLSPDQAGIIRAAINKGRGHVLVSSTCPLEEAQRAGLLRQLERLAGTPVECEFQLAPELLCGLCISVGDWQLQASLGDELRYFTEAGDGGR